MNIQIGKWYVAKEDFELIAFNDEIGGYEDEHGNHALVTTKKGSLFELVEITGNNVRLDNMKGSWIEFGIDAFKDLFKEKNND